MSSPCCLSVCPPLIGSERIGRFHDIRKRGHAIEGDLDSIFFTPSLLAFRNCKVHTPDMDEKLSPVNVEAWKVKFVTMVTTPILCDS
jgi:hypothetical protein